MMQVLRRNFDILPSLVVGLLLGALAFYAWHSGAIKASREATQQAAKDAADLACKTTETKRQSALITHTSETLARGKTVAQVAEKKAQSLDAFFDKLESRADYENKQNPVAAECSLSPERLRIWQEANAGAGGGIGAGGASAKQPDPKASSSATAQERPVAGAGGQSPRGGKGLPPAGDSVLPAAGVSTGAPLR